jgi:pimeloyl-ACP methyl ester carboxylesterase
VVWHVEADMKYGCGKETGARVMPSDAPADTPVVFLHGLFESPAIWEPARRALRAHSIETFAPPLPGHRSDAMRRPASAGMHAGDAPSRHMADVLRLVSGGRRVRLVGHSLGGLIALLIARDNPDLVQDAMVIGTPHAGDAGRVAGLATRLFTEVPLIGPISARLLHQHWLSDAGRFQLWFSRSLAPGECITGLPARVRDELRGGCPETMRDMAVWIRAQATLESFAALQVPVTVTVTARDPVVTAEHQLTLARRLPGALAQVIDSGHLPMVAAPALFQRAVAAWAAHPRPRVEPPVAPADLPVEPGQAPVRTGAAAPERRAAGTPAPPLPRPAAPEAGVPAG